MSSEEVQHKGTDKEKAGLSIHQNEEAAPLEKEKAHSRRASSVKGKVKGIKTAVKRGAKKDTLKKSESKEDERPLSGAEKLKKEDERTRIRIKIRAYDHRIIDRSTRTIVDTVERTGAEVVGPLPLPTEKKKITVLRSTFVHKDSRQQYEMRIHKRMIDIYDPTPQTVDSLTNLSLPAGVDVEIKM